jgi:hypothetical protein
LHLHQAKLCASFLGTLSPFRIIAQHAHSRSFSPHCCSYAFSVFPANTSPRSRRRHIDAALYALSPPKVTTLYAVSVPKGEPQVCRYDDGTGDEIQVPLGGTACEWFDVPLANPTHAVRS